jgi:hypothetical protein
MFIYSFEYGNLALAGARSSVGNGNLLAENNSLQEKKKKPRAAGYQQPGSQ